MSVTWVGADTEKGHGPCFDPRQWGGDEMRRQRDPTGMGSVVGHDTGRLVRATLDGDRAPHPSTPSVGRPPRQTHR